VRILVTGGAGFLGRALCTRLASAGDEVVALDNLSSPSPLPLAPQVRLVRGDVIDPLAVAGPFERVFHLASPASPARYLLDPVGTLRTGAEGTRNVLEAAERWGARVVYASTSEVYGDPERHPQSEDYAGSVQVTAERACYDEAKRYGEALIYAFERSGRAVETRVARLFNTYGPGMHPHDGRVVSNFVVQALRGHPLTIFGDGQQTRSFCYVDDLIEGMLRLADSDHAGPVNLGNPAEITIAGLADVISELIGDTGRIAEPLPEADPKRRRPDIARARSLLGWEPSTDLRTGLRSTIEYFRSLS
jgi:nucleoside-diphosphate-sugar epimerase